MNFQRPLKDFSTSALLLELALRSGPRYQCQTSDCRSMENSPAQFDTCPIEPAEAALDERKRMELESMHLREKWAI